MDIYFFDNLTGILFLAVGLRLLALSRRTGQRPERLLGSNYALFGASYLIYEFPATLGPAFDEVWCGFVGRVVYGIGMLPLMAFISGVFRPGVAWASGLAWANVTALGAGIFLSVLSGDVEGYTLGNPWFWFEWVGYTLPFAWIAVEAALARSAAARRMRLGLCEPLIVNRYALWVVFGVFECANSVALVPLYHEVGLSGEWPAWGDYLAGGLETVATLALWLAFFPPRAYRRWVQRAEPAAQPS